MSPLHHAVPTCSVSELAQRAFSTLSIVISAPSSVRSLLFTRRTAERLSEVETTLKIYLVQQSKPCVTVGEYQIALVGDRLKVNLVPPADTRQAKLPGVFEEEGDLRP